MRWMLLLILLVPALSGADATFTLANDQLAVTAGEYPCGILVVEKGSKLLADGQLIMKSYPAGVFRGEGEKLVITDDVIKAADDDKTGFDLIEELKTNKHNEGFTQDDVDYYLSIAKEHGVPGSFVVTRRDYRVYECTVVDLAHLASDKYTAYLLTQVAKAEDCRIAYYRVKLIR